VPWEHTGQCWAGHDHPVVDVTTDVAETGCLIVIVKPTASLPPSRQGRWQ